MLFRSPCEICLNNVQDEYGSWYCAQGGCLDEDEMARDVYKRQAKRGILYTGFILHASDRRRRSVPPAGVRRTARTAVSYTHLKQVVVCCAGMGKANAAATTQVLITKFGAEKIIFSGIAGNMTSKIGIGDVVIGKTVLYHDAQLDMICQNPPFLKEYTGDPELIAAAEKACAEAGVKALVGKIATGDLFRHNENR